MHIKENCHGPDRTRQPAHAEETASYYVLHVLVASLVAYAVTGNLMLAITLSLLEPSVQAVAFFFHEKAWGRFGRRGHHGPPVAAAA